MSLRLRITAFLAAGFIRLIGWTWRFEIHDQDAIDEARRGESPVIFAFWHGRFLPLCYRYRNQQIHVLASEHEDGELIGQTIRLLGFGHVRGSSTRGGARAIRELVAKIGEGFDLGLTVDGPKGPRYKVKPGPLEISKLSGATIVPAAISSKSHWVFRSWDAFEFPKPFTKVSIRVGRPFNVPSDAGPEDVEDKRKELEGILQELTEINDRYVSKE